MYPRKLCLALRGVASATDTATVLASISPVSEKAALSRNRSLCRSTSISMLSSVCSARGPACQRILTQGVLISQHDSQPLAATDLESETRSAVDRPVGLPAVCEPRLDLQVLRRKIWMRTPLKNHMCSMKTYDG